MRKIIVLEFITLDGVIQAPGRPEEDTTGGFKFGGWCAPYSDQVSAEAMQRQMAPTDILLGRKTFKIFESFWPQHAEHWPGINEVNKYVFSNTINKSPWQNTVFIKSLADIENLKNAEGSDIKVWGSGELAHLLLKHDLVDELWLKIYPVILGEGKRWFDSGAFPAAFILTESLVTPGGIIFANYKRAGDVKSGSIEL